MQRRADTRPRAYSLPSRPANGWLALFVVIAAQRAAVVAGEHDDRGVRPAPVASRAVEDAVRRSSSSCSQQARRSSTGGRARMPTREPLVWLDRSCEGPDRQRFKNHGASLGRARRTRTARSVRRSVRCPSGRSCDRRVATHQPGVDRSVRLAIVRGEAFAGGRVARCLRSSQRVEEAQPVIEAMVRSGMAEGGEGSRRRRRRFHPGATCPMCCGSV